MRRLISRLAKLPLQPLQFRAFFAADLDVMAAKRDEIALKPDRGSAVKNKISERSVETQPGLCDRRSRKRRILLVELLKPADNRCPAPVEPRLSNGPLQSLAEDESRYRGENRPQFLSRSASEM